MTSQCTESQWSVISAVITASTERCPACGHAEFRHFGTGVEEIERILTVQYPDCAFYSNGCGNDTRKDRHEQMLTAFARHEAEIIIARKGGRAGLSRCPTGWMILAMLGQIFMTTG
jgi:hypothetical protein